MVPLKIDPCGMIISAPPTSHEETFVLERIVFSNAVTAVSAYLPGLAMPESSEGHFGNST